MGGKSLLALFFLLALFGVFGMSSELGLASLRLNFYQQTCPNAESIVRNITWTRVGADSDLTPGLLRLHYHDCFVRGCDASILLDKTGAEAPEKEAQPNLTLEGFEVVDDIKTQLEQECPGVVSCADILALAARDAVAFQFKRSLWQVPTGRRDGTISLSSDVANNLPSPFSNFLTLQQLFATKGLNVRDLVALSGAHTIGLSHCDSFSKRLYNFTGKGDTDPALDPTYAVSLMTTCPNPSDVATTVEMEPQSSHSFDSNYFVDLWQKKGLFQSDAALLANPVSAFNTWVFQNQNAFFLQFAISMKKMGAIDVLVGSAGEIRKQCRVVN